MRGRLQQFMAGRYGMDRLGMALLLAAIVLNLIFSFTGILPLRFISLGLIVWELVRLFSRNYARQSAQNRWFEERWGRIRFRASGAAERARQSRDYRFFRCADCGNYLRVPRGKGKLYVTCPKCGKRFSART